MLVGKPDTIVQYDPITEKETQIYRSRDFNTDLITSYRVKEDWMFDRNLGRMVVRIIGIAPIRNILNDDQTLRAQTPLMWIYYPEARPIFAQYEVFNPENDVQRLTWDDFFEGRYWSGRITRVSNADNTNFREAGLNDLESLYESQNMMDRIYEKEHDMWVY
jgi:gliding motility associated protien GldN